MRQWLAHCTFSVDGSIFIQKKEKQSEQENNGLEILAICENFKSKVLDCLGSVPELFQEHKVIDGFVATKTHDKHYTPSVSITFDIQTCSEMPWGMVETAVRSEELPGAAGEARGSSSLPAFLEELREETGGHVQCLHQRLWGLLEPFTDDFLFFQAIRRIALPRPLEIWCGCVTCHRE